MDITLERILSLIPKNEAGKYIHGAKAEFARSLGYSGGEVITMWEHGASKSYKNKLHEIAAKYNVSVEWLRGEPDKKEQTATEAGEGLSARDMALLNWFRSLPQEKQQAILIAQDAPKDIL